MKKILGIISIILVLLCSCIILIACNNGSGTTDAPSVSVTGKLNYSDSSTGNIISGNTINFENVAIEASVQITFTITNNGTADLVLSNSGIVSITGTSAGLYNVSTISKTSLVAGESTNFSITFSPDSAGTKTAAASFTSNVGSYSLTLTGTGVGSPVVSVKADLDDDGAYETSLSNGNTIDFNNVAISSSKEIDLSITNSGSSSLTLSNSGVIALSGDNASVYAASTASTTTLGIGESTSFSITFSPDSSGTKIATATISSNTTDFSLSLTGDGGVPDIAVRGEAYFDDDLKYHYRDGDNNIIDNNGTVDFDIAFSDGDGTPVELSLTINNIGNTNLELSSGVSITGTHSDYFVPTVPASTVPPGGSTNFIIVFASDANYGTKEALLTILTNDPDTPEYKLSLEGYAS